MAEYVDPAAAFQNAAPEPAKPKTAKAEKVKVTPEDEAVAARAAELERQLAEPEPTVVQQIIESDEEPDAPQAATPTAAPARSVVAAERPRPESELTEDEKRIRQLEDQLAKRNARALDSDTAVEYEAFGQGELIEFYVLQDGWTAFGQVWYRGQEIAVEQGSRTWDETLDRNGQSFLEVLHDDRQQIQLYGDLFIRKGRWPGAKYEDERAAAAEARRNRAAPLLKV